MYYTCRAAFVACPLPGELSPTRPPFRGTVTRTRHVCVVFGPVLTLTTQANVGAQKGVIGLDIRWY